MQLTALALAFLALLAIAYRTYGRCVARRIGLDDARRTPAHEKRDGVDYEPTRPFYLFGQHFSAIAAAGPIAGPILACQSFGWLPCLLWIGLGVVFIGAVHDFATLIGSVRHGGCSIAEIARERLGSPAGTAMMAFIWIALVYVIVAFTDITAGSFARGTEELEGGGVRFNPGGAVAAASVLYLGLSIVLGLVQRFLRPPLWLVTVIFVPATFALSWFGTRISDWLVFGPVEWGLLILCYCAVASVLPVWALLQPRGYLGGFVLYTALALGIVGVLFGGYVIEQPAFKTWDTGRATGTLFPFLFVTIACGACSGFHGLVCSGTTSKQVDRESHTRPVGYGAMLAEAFVALVALVTVVIFTQADLVDAAGRPLKPGTIYGNGIGQFMTLLVGRENLAFAITFGAMAFSTFVFDTLDVATRLGRYLVQELSGWRGLSGAVFGTVITIVPAALFLAYGGEGSYLRFWTLFGASNQLLAALSLISIAVWLRQEGKSSAFVLVPAAFVLAITVWALAEIARVNLTESAGLDVKLANGASALALLALALYLVATGVRRLRLSAEARRPEPG
ncbi:MAG: carbon starvation protein A [Planctomycetes bacterium]|nr:carbon starvation protein A [Planctomycetota bacterium]